MAMRRAGSQGRAGFRVFGLGALNPKPLKPYQARTGLLPAHRHSTMHLR